MSDVLLSAQAGRVVTLTMNRVEALNALNQESIRALRKAFEAASRDASVGCVILTGAGRAFCTGADLREVSGRYDAGDTELGEDLRRNYSPLIRAIRACSKPVIAAINGTAAGAGLSLALACDIRLASTAAQLIVVFVRVGLVPDAGSAFFLPRLVGWGRALDMVLTGDPVSAEEALRFWLVTRVWPDGEFATQWRELAQTLARGATEAFALTKEGLNAAMARGFAEFLDHEAELQDRAGRTHDYAEGVKAFSEKRPAKMEGH